MELTNEIKERVRAAIIADRENYPSDNRPGRISSTVIAYCR